MSIELTDPALILNLEDEDQLRPLPIGTPRYYLGVTAVNDSFVRQNLYKAAGRLRAQVYIDEMGFLPHSERQADGTETDPDDARSIHLAVSETLPGESDERVIGVTRLIQKRDETDTLPVEQLFNITSAPVGSLEVSRFIARASDRKLQGRVSLALMRTAALLGVESKAPKMYAVVEEPLFRYFQHIGLPFEPISELEWLDEYHSKNLAVQIDPNNVIPALQRKDKQRGSVAVAPFFVKEVSSKGIGHFGPEF